MILDDLLILAQSGSKNPLDLWWSDQESVIKKKLLPELDKVVSKIKEGTKANQNMLDLIAILKQDRPDELELAKKLSYVAEVFLEHPGKADQKTKEKVHEYVQEVKQMFSIAQQSQFHYDYRQKIAQNLDDEKQKAFDLKLFKNEGMNYCLEYYLAVYKKIQNAEATEEKRKYIESSQINLGFGQLPGLWHDFKQDEVLTKFIYSILDDKTRNDLVQQYFKTKNVIMKIHMDCDKQGLCSAEYSEIDLEQVISSLKELLIVMIDTFSKVGITSLSSLYFKPYGEKPSLEEVKTLI